MEKSKLIISLRTLNKTESKSFLRFLQSPYFNKRADVVQLFELIRLDLLKENPISSSAVLYQQVYHEPFDDQKFRLLKSYLFRLLEKFITIEEMMKETADAQLYLAKGYRNKGLNNAFEKVIEQTIKKLEQMPIRNTDYFAQYSQLLWEQHQSLAVVKPSENNLLKATSEQVDYAYLALKLKHICLLAAHKNIYSTSFETGFLSEILHYIEQDKFQNMPAIAAYYFGYLLHTQADKDNNFKQFKQTIFQHGQSFPNEEIRILFLLGINFAIQQINNGKKTYMEELKDLYMEGLKQGYLFENGQLSRFTYLNIVTTGLKIGDYDWVENIIYTYQTALDKKYRENAFNFNLARLEYSRQHYEKAMPLLQQCNPQNILLNLTAKVLLLKIFYELSELDALHAHLDAMRHFIRRKKIIGYHKVKHIALISYVQKLIKLNPYDKMAKQTLYKKVSAEEDLMEKEWVLAQLQY